MKCNTWTSRGHHNNGLHSHKAIIDDQELQNELSSYLIVMDGYEGLLAALAELFPATPRQRCLVHKQRNVLNAIPRPAFPAWVLLPPRAHISQRKAIVMVL